MSSISLVRWGRSLSVTSSRPYKMKFRNAGLSTTLIAYELNIEKQKLVLDIGKSLPNAPDHLRLSI